MLEEMLRLLRWWPQSATVGDYVVFGPRNVAAWILKLLVVLSVFGLSIQDLDLVQFMQSTGQTNTLILPAGVFSLSTNLTWDFSSTIPQNVTILGAGSPAAASEVMTVTDADVAITGESLDSSVHNRFLSLLVNPIGAGGTIIQCIRPAAGIWVDGAAVVTVANVTIKNCSLAVSIHNTTQVTLISSALVNNNGGALELQDVGAATISNSMFINNSAPQSGGAVSWALTTAYTSLAPAVLTVAQTRIHGNRAAEQGGGVFIKGAGQVTVTYTVFTGNMAVGGAGVMLSGGAVAKILKSRFSRNVADAATSAGILVSKVGPMGAGIYASGACLSLMTDTTVSNNLIPAWGLGSGMSVEDTAGATSCKNVTVWRNLLFVGNVGGLGSGGGAIRVSNIVTLILLSESSFVNNSVPGEGGAMRIDYTNLFRIDRCNFTYNRAFENGGAVLVSQSGLQMSNSTFAYNSGNTGGGVAVVTSSLLSDQGTVYIGNTAARVGGAVACVQCYRLLQTRALYQNNTALAGGALMLYRNTAISVLDSCTFIGNTALPPQAGTAGGPDCSPEGGGGAGGAVCVDIATSVLATQNKYIGNTAYAGGGLFLQRLCPWTNSSSYVCKGFLSTFETYINNTAIRGAGGAIHTQQVASAAVICSQNDPFMSYIQKSVPLPIPFDYMPPVTCPWWAGNRVQGGYGPVISSGPTVLVATDVSRVDDDGSHTPMKVQVQPKHISMGVYQSNTNLKVALRLVDYNGRVVTSTLSNQACQVTARITSSANTSHPMLFGATTTVISGTAIFPELRLKGLPGLYGISFRADCAQISPEIQMQVEVRACVRGETPREGGAVCVECEANSYSFDPTTPTCMPCSKAGLSEYCCGGVIMPSKGYWHSSPQSPIMHRCPVSQACYGDLSTVLPPPQLCTLPVQAAAFQLDGKRYMALQCAKGHTGNVCMRCQPGYAKDARQMCRKCASTLIQGLSITGALLLNMAIIGLAAWHWITAAAHYRCPASSASHSQPAPSGSLGLPTKPAKPHEVAIQVLVRHLQVMAMFSHIPSYTSKLPSLHQVNRLVMMEQSVATLECSMTKTGVLWSAARIAYSLLIPVGFLLVGLLGCWVAGVAAAFRRRSTWGDCLRVLRLQALIITWIIADYCYTNLTLVLGLMFSCKVLDSTDLNTPPGSAAGLHAIGRFWTQDYNVKCSEGIHRRLVMGVAIPGILLFSAGIPLGLIRWMHVHRADLETPEFFQHYAFLYSQYKPDFCWWAGAEMLYKLSVAVVITAFNSLGPAWQLPATLLVMITFWYFTCKFCPYRKGFERVQRASKTSLLALWYMLLLEVPKMANTNIWARVAVLSTISLVVNLTTLAYLLLTIVVEFVAGLDDMMRKVIDEDKSSTREAVQALVARYGWLRAVPFVVGYIPMFWVKKVSVAGVERIGSVGGRFTHGMSQVFTNKPSLWLTQRAAVRPTTEICSVASPRSRSTNSSLYSPLPSESPTACAGHTQAYQHNQRQYGFEATRNHPHRQQSKDAVEGAELDEHERILTAQASEDVHILAAQAPKDAHILTAQALKDAHILTAQAPKDAHKPTTEEPKDARTPAAKLPQIEPVLTTEASNHMHTLTAGPPKNECMPTTRLPQQSCAQNLQDDSFQGSHNPVGGTAAQGADVQEIQPMPGGQEQWSGAAACGTSSAAKLSGTQQLPYDAVQMTGHSSTPLAGPFHPRGRGLKLTPIGSYTVEHT